MIELKSNLQEWIFQFRVMILCSWFLRQIRAHALSNCDFAISILFQRIGSMLQCKRFFSDTIEAKDNKVYIEATTFQVPHTSRHWSRLASAKTTAAFLPPSSRESFFIIGAATRAICWPTAVDPVKEIIRTFYVKVHSHEILFSFPHQSSKWDQNYWVLGFF